MIHAMKCLQFLLFTDRIRGKGNAIGSVRPSVFGLEIEVPTDL